MIQKSYIFTGQQSHISQCLMSRLNSITFSEAVMYLDEEVQVIGQMIKITSQYTAVLGLGDLS